MSLVPFTFMNVELKVVTIIGKPWTRAKEVRKTLGYLKKTADVIKQLCSLENFAHKHELSKFRAVGNLMNWPSDSRKDDYYLNEEGMYGVLFSSQQPLERKLRKRCSNVMFLHIRQQLADKLLEDRDNRIQAIEYENAGLQCEIRAKDQQI